MQINYQERGSDSNAFLAIYYSQKDSMYAEDESNPSLGDLNDSPLMRAAQDSQIFDKKKVLTSVTLFTGKKLDQKINLEQFIE